MTSNYKDSTSFVGDSSLANDFTMLQNYSSTGFQAVPQSSLLKLSVAPGNDKYFSAAPSFQARLDNFRIAAPAKTPINLSGNGDSSFKMTGSEMPQINGSDYFTLGAGAYKMSSQ